MKPTAPPFAGVPATDLDHEAILLALVHAVLAALEPPHATSPLFIQQLLRALQTHLLARYGAAHAGEGGLSPQQLLRAQQYLLGHPLQSLYVAQAAQHCGLSRGYFSKAFKLSMGLSPLQWTLQSRIYQVAVLLRCGTPLTDIAAACGFANPRHLARCFRRAMGLTPRAWLREYP